VKNRRLGRTGFEVSEISFGARWLYPSKSPREPATPERDEIGREVVRSVPAAGINHIDTAPGYPHSERLLGEVIGDREDIIISTKVWSADEEAIRKSVKSSQERLRRRPLDLYMLHGLQFVDGLPVLKALQAEGEVRFIGISSGAGGAEKVKELVAEGAFDFYQLACNLLHPEMAEEVFRLCREADVGVQVMSPMYRGVITGRPELVTDLNRFGITTLEQAALRWLLDVDPAVVPIPGTSRPERVAHLVSASAASPVPMETWRAFQEKLQAVPEMQVEI